MNRNEPIALSMEFFDATSQNSDNNLPLTVEKPIVPKHVYLSKGESYEIKRESKTEETSEQPANGNLNWFQSLSLSVSQMFTGPAAGVDADPI